MATRLNPYRDRNPTYKRTSNTVEEGYDAFQSAYNKSKSRTDMAEMSYAAKKLAEKHSKALAEAFLVEGNAVFEKILSGNTSRLQMQEVTLNLGPNGHSSYNFKPIAGELCNFVLEIESNGSVTPTLLGLGTNKLSAYTIYNSKELITGVNNIDLSRTTHNSSNSGKATQPWIVSSKWYLSNEIIQLQLDGTANAVIKFKLIYK